MNSDAPVEDPAWPSASSPAADILRKPLNLALKEINALGYRITRDQWETMCRTLIVPPATRSGLTPNEMRRLTNVIKIRDSMPGRVTMARLAEELKKHGLSLP
jgi:hypothetical protein